MGLDFTMYSSLIPYNQFQDVAGLGPFWARNKALAVDPGGEKWCRLNHSAQKRQRHPFAITLIVVGAVSCQLQYTERWRDSRAGRLVGATL